MKFVDGKKIYQNGDWLTPGQVELRFPQFKKRTLQSWRSAYEDSGGIDKIGPKWHCFGLRIRRYLFSDIMRAINNLTWLEPYPPFFRDHLNKSKKESSVHLATSTHTPQSKSSA